MTEAKPTEAEPEVEADPVCECGLCGELYSGTLDAHVEACPWPQSE